MNDHDADHKSRKAYDADHQGLTASIPGDPFPWEPEQLKHDLEPEETPPGATPSPAQSADLDSYDLGGGD